MAPEHSPALTPATADDVIGYSVNDAARVSVLSRAKLYELMSAGKLAYCKIDKRRIITRPAITKLFADHEAA